MTLREYKCKYNKEVTELNRNDDSLFDAKTLVKFYGFMGSRSRVSEGSNCFSRCEILLIVVDRFEISSE